MSYSSQVLIKKLYINLPARRASISRHLLHYTNFKIKSQALFYLLTNSLKCNIILSIICETESVYV